MKKISYIITAAVTTIAIYGCEQSRATENFVEGAAFEYREVYLPTTGPDENKQLELNNLDDDWGLWGHNLANVLPEDPSLTVYATLNGNIEEEQYCFTSDKLFQYFCDYVDNNYGSNGAIRFAVVPNDNVVACLCEECVAIGNTPGNATPAVFDFVSRLARKYPNHTFFTSHYLTTEKLPSKKLPENTGVLISAMQYPLAAGPTPQEEKFKNVLKSWQGKTDKVYIWDYINDFDDYFTPYPVFNVMQRRFQTYRDLGVHGVFLNGSGEDYSTFSRLKKAVLAQMLINPDLDWKETLRDYAVKYYPEAGNDIADFIIAQEEMVASHGQPLPMYEGVETARKLYIPEREFADFYKKVQTHKKLASGWEKKELETMAEALSLTVLELKRIKGQVDEDGHLQRRLARLPAKGIETYNEGYWSIKKYLENYKYILDQYEQTKDINMLRGVKLQAKSALDPDYSDISIVTNGLLGIASNYHSGNLISSADPALNIGVPRINGMKKLKIWLSYNPGFKIGLPQEVWLVVGGEKVASVEPSRPVGESGHTSVEFNLPPSGDIVLSFRKNPDVKTFAIDEIQGYAD